MKISIAKSSSYTKNGIKDITLGGEPVGCIYPVEGEDHRGIWEINNYRGLKGWSETPDGYAVELKDNSDPLRETFQQLTGRNYPGTNFWFRDRSPTIAIFPTMKEARKFARDNFGTPELLRAYLVEIILTTMRERATAYLERANNESL